MSDHETPDQSATHWQSLQRSDGIYNELTGMGGSLDLASGEVNRPNTSRYPLTPAELDSAFRFCALAARLINDLPEDVGRRGMRVVDPDGKTLFDLGFGLAADLGLIDKWVEAQKFARRRCNAGVLWVTDDIPVGDLTAYRTPLRLPTARIYAAHVFEGRTELIPQAAETNLHRRDFGMPSRYTVIPVTMTGSRSFEVDASRVSWFRATKTPRRMRDGNIYDDPILWSLWDALQRWEAGQNGIAMTMHRLMHAVMNLPGLLEKLTGENAASMDAVIVKLKKAYNSLGVHVLPEGGSMTVNNNSPSGVGEAMSSLNHGVAASTGQSFVQIFGEPPSGFNSDGRSQWELRDRSVSAEFELMKPAIRHGVKILMSCPEGPTGGIVPKAWDVELYPASEETAAEKADTAVKTASAWSVYVDRGMAPKAAAALVGIDLPDGAYASEESGDLTVSGILGDALTEALWVSAPVDATTIERVRVEAMRILGTGLVARGAPHLTLLYLGADHAEEDAAELVSIAESVAARSQPDTLSDWRVTTFPPGEDGTPVVLESPEGWAAERVHEALLRGAAHLIHARQWPEYRAHITLGYLRESPTEEQVAALGEIDALDLEVPLTLLRVAAGDRTLSTVALRG